MRLVAALILLIWGMRKTSIVYENDDAENGKVLEVRRTPSLGALIAGVILLSAGWFNMENETLYIFSFLLFPVLLWIIAKIVREGKIVFSLLIFFLLLSVSVLIISIFHPVKQLPEPINPRLHETAASCAKALRNGYREALFMAVKDIKAPDEFSYADRFYKESKKFSEMPARQEEK